MPLLCISNLSYTFPRSAATALSSLHLRINPGDRLWLAGHNASGKSTLLKLIAGLLEPSDGTLTWDSSIQALSRTAILFQDPASQIIAERVDSEIAFNLENRGVPTAEMLTRIRLAAAQYNIAHLLHKETNSLSGGEVQKVGIAAVTIDSASILLLDEPDSFLDSAGLTALESALASRHRLFPACAEIRISQKNTISRGYNRLVILREGELEVDIPLHADSERKVSAYAKTGSLTAPPPVASHASSHEIARLSAVTLSVARSKKSGLLLFPDICLKSGEIVGLEGATGCGKTTLGLLLCGLLKPKTGEILFTTTKQLLPIREPNPSRITMVFQQPEMQFALATAQEELLCGPRNLKIPLDNNDLASLLSLAGLDTSILPRDPHSLSAGQQRRLAFVCALTTKPGAVIFDEPTAGLDPKGVEQFTSLATRLKQSNAMQLVISHDTGLLAALCDRVISLAPPPLENPTWQT